MAMAQVESANTVGFTTTAAPQGTFIIMGVQLDQVAANGARDLNALVSGVQGVNWDEDKVFTRTAAQVQIPFGAGYKTCYYLNDGWFDDGTEEGDYAPGWCDGDGALVETTIPVAQGFWTKGVSGTFTLTFAK